MATTDAKSGFRLPWSSDRSATSPDSNDPEAAEAAATPWPETDTAQGDAGPNAPVADPAGHHELPSEGTVSAPISAPAIARKAPAKPTKFLADLTKAMQAAAEAAREQTLTQFQADAKTFVELIHERSAGESAALKAQADADIDGIRTWSKAEIARIREETEAKIAARKVDLEGQVEEHASRIERQVEAVQGSVSAFEREMATFFEELLEEGDPARFAALAETLPEPPSFEDILPEAFESVEAAQATAAVASDAVAEDEADGSAESTDEVATGELATADSDATSDPSADLEIPEALADVEPSGEPVDRASVMAALEAAAEATVAAEMAAESASQAEVSADVAETAAELLAQKVEGPDATGGWPTGDFDTAEAEAALAARIDASDADLEAESASFADRLAALMPQPGAEQTADMEVRSTQLVVVGLVSVASIASFKRHVGRIPGVDGVGVSSGPDGEFVFTVSHRGDVNFRDAVPSLPGFAARVTGTGEGVVNVTARDPESEA